jgi:hypothetical protein
MSSNTARTAGEASRYSTIFTSGMGLLFRLKSAARAQTVRVF